MVCGRLRGLVHGLVAARLQHACKGTRLLLQGLLLCSMHPAACCTHPSEAADYSQGLPGLCSQR